MFDCINEVLFEVCEDHFGCCPWVAFIKPGIRPELNQECGLRKVWEGFRWHLRPLPRPCTLDHIVSKDIANSGYWMDFTF
ncbi:hypothetical protein MLD38_023470 [Melastoma candidum]|uniref:Uncharacterized protein n=1 Tax=Melastoma candidum TaxID=119954 RepID=A0ACB9NQX0_9MYRT|nr:hypothetical protein MLD38_023470 [Melastoma candidum]